jgi:outer membrane protein
MRTRQFFSLVSLALCFAEPLRADEVGRWELRVRTIFLQPTDQSTAVYPIESRDDGLHVAGNWVPDIDVEYFFTRTWSAEVMLNYPEIEVATVTDSIPGRAVAVGAYRRLPPVITAKYNFPMQGAIKPYLGLGINIRVPNNSTVVVPNAGGLTLHSSRVGPAAQFGVDVQMSRGWYFNLDMRWVHLHSNVSVNGTNVAPITVDPVFFGIGLGYRFGESL